MPAPVFNKVKVAFDVKQRVSTDTLALMADELVTTFVIIIDHLEVIVFREYDRVWKQFPTMWAATITM